MSEAQAIGQLEKSHFTKKPRNKLRIAMETMPIDWMWSSKEVRIFKELWKKDVPLRKIAFELDKDEFDCIPLALELIYLEQIKPRPTWNIW